MFLDWTAQILVMAMQAPPIGQPAFNLHADQGERIKASNIIFIILPTFFVILRLVSRKISSAGYWVRRYRLPNNGSRVLIPIDWI